MEYLTDEDYRIAEKNGISKSNVYQRFYIYGWTREKTISEPIFDKSIGTLYKKKCAEIGLSYSTFRKRVSKGMRPEEALFVPEEPKLTFELLAIAEQNGIGTETAKIRVYAYKWDVERAVTEPVHEKFRRKNG